MLEDAKEEDEDEEEPEMLYGSTSSVGRAADEAALRAVLLLPDDVSVAPLRESCWSHPRELLLKLTAMFALT